MTCVWNSLIAGIPNEIFQDLKLGKCRNKKRRATPEQFVTYLKNKATKISSVKINDEGLSQKQVEENYEHVKNFDTNSIHKGYYCSACDPFLILVCGLFNCSINHHYLDTVINYEHQNPKFRIAIRNDYGHMSYNGTVNFEKNTNRKKKKKGKK